MTEQDWLAERFEEQRPRLRAVAYRMLGSAAEADDAVQAAWLRVSAAGAGEVDNLAGWLTTIVSRVSLNMLRSRSTRREDSLESSGLAGGLALGPDPEEEALLADSVGPALLVVLDALSPPERLAFVLHDLFAVPFGEIGSILGRSPTACRQLASRARRRVRGSQVRSEDIARQRPIVEAFLAASRAGDFDALLAVLDPDVVLRADASAGPTRTAQIRRGAVAVASGARMQGRRSAGTRLALVNGSVGLIFLRRGRLAIALCFGFSDDRIATIDVVADPERLQRLEVAPLEA